MFYAKGAAGAGFKIAFEVFCFVFVGEPNADLHFPGFVFVGAGGFSSVVIEEALFGVGGDSSIELWVI